MRPRLTTSRRRRRRRHRRRRLDWSSGRGRGPGLGRGGRRRGRGPGLGRGRRRRGRRRRGGRLWRDNRRQLGRCRRQSRSGQAGARRVALVPAATLAVATARVPPISRATTTTLVSRIPLAAATLVSTIPVVATGALAAAAWLAAYIDLDADTNFAGATTVAVLRLGSVVARPWRRPARDGDRTPAQRHAGEQRHDPTEYSAAEQSRFGYRARCSTATGAGGLSRVSIGCVPQPAGRCPPPRPHGDAAPLGALPAAQIVEHVRLVMIPPLQGAGVQ
jgi:hypothetical protein